MMSDFNLYSNAEREAQISRKQNLKMMGYRFYFTLILLGATTSIFGQYCTEDNRFTEIEFFSSDDIDSVRNAIYASPVDWEGNAVDLALDLYFPSRNIDPLVQRPFILLIHGGGFRGGDRSQLRDDCREFAKRGYVAATMSYRLGWDMTIPADQLEAIYRAQQDANAALRYIVNIAETIGVDTAWMFIGGQSAGAITALNTVYLGPEDWGLVVPGITNELGALDESGNMLTQQFSLKGIYNNWGATFISGIQQEELVPTIAFHGFLDNTVPIGYVDSIDFGGSSVIHDTLIANGICSELTVDSTGGHGIYRPNTPEGGQYRAERASCFFKSLFCDNCDLTFLTAQIFAECSSFPTATQDLEDRLNLRIYPNPFYNSLNIDGDATIDKILLINTMGKTIQTVNNIQDFELEGLPAGMYFIVLEVEETLQTFKMMKGA